jgi:altronate hydrolase
MAKTPDFIRLHANDDVVIACRALQPGERLEAENLEVLEQIPPGHKIATRAIAAGAEVRRYNQVIGFAKSAIAAGQHVHTQNLGVGEEFSRDYAFCEARKDPEKLAHPATFDGYVRANGKVGTRNYIAVIASVNCSATVVRKVCDHFNRSDILKSYPQVDGVVPIVHNSGCGMNGNGLDMLLLRRTIQGFAAHPNFAGVLLVGLGCELNQIGPMMDNLSEQDRSNVQHVVIQESGGTAGAITLGIDAVAGMLVEADKARREPVSLSHLIIGLNCGGSDGYSGITANPALGGMVDTLVAHGGTAILSETPEIYGAEHLLTRRADTPEIGQKLIGIIDWWRDYTARNDCEMNNNPSVGNKVGGLTTILEKSLGAVAKGGTTTLKAVYNFAEPVTAKGFVFMDTPGYDPVSATGQAAGGAQLICFTTGRGSAFGCAGVPTLKFATNNALWERQRDDMDVNCGEIITGQETMEHLSARMLQEVIDYASGKRTRSEELGYGQDEFIPWKVGAVM